MVQGFSAFAGRIDELFALRQWFDAILHEIAEATGPVDIFKDPVDITADGSELPRMGREHKDGGTQEA